MKVEYKDLPIIIDGNEYQVHVKAYSYPGTRDNPPESDIELLDIHIIMFGKHIKLDNECFMDIYEENSDAIEERLWEVVNQKYSEEMAMYYENQEKTND